MNADPMVEYEADVLFRSEQQAALYDETPRLPPDRFGFSAGQVVAGRFPGA
jgi:hypothetical protein